jgi:radical SAM superfamily enzyme YgiQ (UPF0313 family)
MVKVLLVQPFLWPFQIIQDVIDKKYMRSFDKPRYCLPLGILHIASLLEEKGVDVKFLDMDKKFFKFVQDSRIKDKSIDAYFDRYLIACVKEYQPDIIGIGWSFNCNKTFVQLCCEKIKKHNKDISVILGGHYPTTCYIDIFKNSSDIDYIVLGEGEFVMFDVVNAFIKGEKASLNQHPHVVTKDNIQNNILDNKSPAIIENLEVLPSINYELVEEIDDYINSPQDVRTIVPRQFSPRILVMMTSRGCPNQCTYCSSHKVHGRKIRAFSVDRVIDDLDDLVKKYDINTLIFEDDLFTYSRSRTVELCKKIYERFKDRFYIEFPNGIAVKTMNEEVTYWMVKAGMKHINIAIESGNQYVQNEVIKKRLNLKLVKPVVEILKKYDVIVRAYFIIGFPGETLEMMRDTKNFAKELKLDWAMFSFASPLAGSELWETSLANDCLAIKDLDRTTYTDAQLRSEHWTREEVMQIHEEANIEVNYLENNNLREGDYAKSILIFQDILQDYPDHLMANYCLWKSQVGLGDYLEAGKTEKKLYEIVKKESKTIEFLKKYNLLDTEPFKNFLNESNVLK